MTTRRKQLPAILLIISLLILLVPGAAAAAPLTINGLVDTIAIQDRATFTVTGGTPGTTPRYTPYRWTVTPANATISYNYGNTYTIFGKTAGTCTVTFTDAAGKTVSETITVVAGQFRIECPANLTWTASPQFFYLDLKGGPPPYNIAFSNPNILKLHNWNPSRGSVLTQVMLPGTVTITARDSAGHTATKTITVTDPNAAKPLGFAANIAAGQQLKTNTHHALNPVGGKPPYTFATSSASLKIAGGSAMVAFAPGVYTVTLTDSAGQKIAKQFTFITNEAIQGLTLKLSATTLKVGETVTLAVTGGAAPYTVKAPSNVAATPNGPAAFLIKGLAYHPDPITIHVADSQGKGAYTQLTVKSAELHKVTLSAKEIFVGDTATLAIYGGSPPFTVADNLGVVSATSLATNAYKLTGLKPGLANIIVRDSRGTPVGAAITVKEKPKPPKLSVIITNPTLYTVGPIGQTRILTVSGGVEPYTVKASNTNIAITPQGETATGSNAYAITARAAGASTLTITDAAGQKQQITVTVIAGKGQ